MPVLIRTNEHHFLQEFAYKIIPIKFVSRHRREILDVALKIDLLIVHDRSPATQWKGSCDCSHCRHGVSAAIIPGEYLQTLVQLLNSYDSILRFKGGHQRHFHPRNATQNGGSFNRLVFNFSPPKPHYRENITGRLMEGLRGIRWSQSRDSVHGIFATGLSSEAAHELSNSALPPLSEKGYIKMAKSLKEQGDILAKKGQYIGARKDYTLAIIMLGRGENALFPTLGYPPFWEGPFSIYQKLPAEAFTLLMNLYSSLERVSAKLEFSFEPRRLSQVRRTLLRSYCKNGRSQYTEQEQISAIISHYENAIKDGNFSVAGDTVKFGTKEFPHSLDLQVRWEAFPDARAQYCQENNTDIRELRAKEKEAQNKLRNGRDTLTKAERVQLEKEKSLLSMTKYKLIVRLYKRKKSTKHLREGIPAHLFPNLLYDSDADIDADSDDADSNL